MAQKNYYVDLYLNDNQIYKAVLNRSSLKPYSTTEITAIQNPPAGEIVYDYTLGAIKYFNGTSWIILSVGGDITTALSNLSYSMTALTGANVISAVNQANGKISVSTRALTKSDIGLGNVNNTADSAKPVSTAQQTAIDTAKTSAINTSKITVTKSADGLTYTLSQGGTAISPIINIPKDMVVNSGSIQTGTWSNDAFTPSASGTDKALALVLANNGGTVYIDVKDLVDVYTASNSATIKLTINDSNVIAAEIISGSITSDHLSSALKTSLTSATITAPTASNTQATAGTITISSLFQTLVNNIAYLFNNKVDKVSGKGLSTNDYTTAEKNKLASIAEGAEVNVQSDWNITDVNSDAYIKNKPSITNYYKKTVTAGASGTQSGTILTTEHGCGIRPLVQVFVNGHLSETSIAIDSAGQIEWSGTNFPSSATIEIVISGR